MAVFFWGLILFFSAFLLHLIIWKLHMPKRQIKVLLIIYFCTLLIGLFCLWYFSLTLPVSELSRPVNFFEYFHIALLFIALTLSYIVTYSALEVDSPSLVMIMSIYHAGPDGLDKDVFDQTMSDEILVKPRLNDLITHKMAYMDGDKFKLANKGTLLVRIINCYRKLLKAGYGG